MKFQVERWDDLWRDGQEIFHIHFEEIALHKDKVPLGMDDGMYRRIEAAGNLHVLTARVEERLVGYYVALVLPNHPHNREAGKVSTCDMFYMLPAFRKGGAGAKLLLMAEKSLRDLGVKKATMSTKLKMSHQGLLEALGWENTDLVFQKIP